MEDQAAVKGFDGGPEEDSLNDALRCRFETLRVGFCGALECRIGPFFSRCRARNVAARGGCRSGGGCNGQQLEQQQRA